MSKAITIIGYLLKVLPIVVASVKDVLEVIHNEKSQTESQEISG